MTNAPAQGAARRTLQGARRWLARIRDTEGPWPQSHAISAKPNYRMA